MGHSIEKIINNQYQKEMAYECASIRTTRIHRKMMMTVIRRRFLSVSLLLLVVAAFLLPLLLVDGAFFISSSSSPPLSSSSSSRSRRSNGRGDCNGRKLLLAQCKSSSSSSRSSSLLLEGTSTTESMVVMEPPPPSTTNTITTKSIQRQQQLQEKEATPLSPPPPSAPAKVKAKASLPYMIKIQEEEKIQTDNNNNTESCRRRRRDHSHNHNHKIIKPFTNLMIRYLEDDDLPSVVRMYVKEFGPANQNHNIIIRLQDVVNKLILMSRRRRHDNNNNNNNNSLGDGVTTKNAAAIEEINNNAFVSVYNVYTYVHNFILAFSIYLGLISRIRWKNYSTTRQHHHQPDYHILCLADNETNQIIGIAELSWQLPYQTSPPYILPLSIKRLLSKFVYRFNLPIAAAAAATTAATTTKDNTSGCDDDDDSIALTSSPANDDGDEHENLIRLYVSNVIIHESYRGYNYGSVLMREVIRHAKEYFQPSNDQLTLHVDTSSSSSAPISSNDDDGDGTPNNHLVAQSLYLKMGFRPIQDERSRNTDMLLSLLDSSPFPSSNEKRKKEGIFFCDGKPMMYMRKYLSD